MLKYITFQNDACATCPAEVDRKMISVQTDERIQRALKQSQARLIAFDANQGALFTVARAN